MRTAHTVGSRYEETADLDIAEIAKLVRADIKAARKAGEIPADVKISVRIDRYSMGQAIYTSVKVPGPDRVPASDPRSCAHHNLADREDPTLRCTMTSQQVLVKDRIQRIVDQYNYDNSEVLTDYFDSRFHGIVQVEGTDR